MSGTIVVGVEGTEPSRVALRWSMKRAATTGSDVRLITVVDSEWAGVGARILDDIHADAERLLEREAEYARSIAPDVSVETELREGDLMEELIAASQYCDLIAVGTHKTGFIHGKVFGSRSLQLAAAAHSPVAIVPQTSRRDGHGIVVGVDESDAGRSAIRFAAGEAERTGQPLIFLRASDAPGLPEDRDDEQQERDRYFERQTRAILSEASDIAKSVDPTVEVRARSVRRPAAEALLDSSASADLLVIGSSRREGSAGRMLGSVSHDVLINLVGPTIVVQGEGR
jgi:nucleotide-binding universal stress UspA family protein